jgi:hypothetical protein
MNADRSHPCGWCGRPTRGRSYYFIDGFRLCVMHSSSDEPSCGDVFLSRSIEDERNARPKTHPPLGKTGNPEDTP